MGSAGLQIVSILGGLVSSASTTAASASLAVHGKISAAQAGVSAVLTSMASALINLPIVQKQLRSNALTRELTISSLLQIGAGLAVLILEAKLFRPF